MGDEAVPKTHRLLRTIDLQPGHGEMIKPAEVIDITDVSHLSLSARRLYNKLIAHAFGPDMAMEGHEWTVSTTVLKDAHRGDERFEESIVALMKTIGTVRLSDGSVRRAQLLGGNDLFDPGRERGSFTYSLDKRLVELLRYSTVFSKLELKVMMAFTTKYALALYEAIARRVRLQHRFSEEWSLEELRDILAVPEGKLTKFGNLNQYAIKPAVAEINALACFRVKVLLRKEGRKVVGVMVGWWLKDEDALKEAYAELERPKVGRMTRIRGEVEEMGG